jgi:hypothetical protein
MKTWKILSSEDRVLTFTENDLVYTLFTTDEDGDEITIIKAVDNGDGFHFIDNVPNNMDYSYIDYMHLFLNLIGKMDDSLFESYVITEPIGQI